MLRCLCASSKAEPQGRDAFSWISLEVKDAGQGSRNSVRIDICSGGLSDGAGNAAWRPGRSCRRGTPRRRLRSGPAAAAGRPRADRPRQDLIRHQLHRLSWADLRGGDIGGPNLLRSQVALSDQDGELILPIIQGSRQNAGMPAIAMSPEDAKAVAAYVRSVVATIGRQGMPPAIGLAAPSVLVGNAARARRTSLPSAAVAIPPPAICKALPRDISDPKALQNTWVSGGGGRWPRRRTRGAAAEPERPHRHCRRHTAREKAWKAGSCASTTSWSQSAWPTAPSRTFRRNGDVPKVEVHDPMQAHQDLLPVYTDKDMHDVTAYLVTLK